MGERARSQLDQRIVDLSCPKLPISRVFAAVSQGLGSLHNDGDPSLRSPVTGSDPFTGKIEEHHTVTHGPQLYMRRTAPSSGRTDVHQTSTPRYTTIHHVQCRHRRPPAVYVVPRFGGKFRVKFWGPLFGAQVFLTETVITTGATQRDRLTRITCTGSPR